MRNPPDQVVFCGRGSTLGIWQGGYGCRLVKPSRHTDLDHLFRKDGCRLFAYPMT
jgi:hypothetical protein